MLITIAIPCYRSAKTLPAVVAGIRAEFALHPEHDYQIILVNDGSPDDTFAVIRQLCGEDKKIVGVDLSRNFTQANARMAAIPYMKGQVAIYMDDDGQHPPQTIFRLVDKVNEGYDLVYAAFTKKKHSFFKRFTSGINARLLEMTGAKPKGITQSPYFAWSRFAIETMAEYHSPFPSSGPYLMRKTNRVTCVESEHKARLEGHSGYTLRKLINRWLITFTNFSSVPLRFSMFLGMGTAAAGFLTALVLIIRKLMNPGIQAGYTSLMAAILFVGGVIMMILGLMGEYLGKIYMTISDLPQYTVRTVLNEEQAED